MPDTPARRRRPPVPELTAPSTTEHAALYRTKAFPFVSEGAMYCFGLREYLVEPSIPRGESAISALLALDAGIVFGVTSGARAHLFYFHPGFGVAHVGPLGETACEGGALLDLGGNRVLGGWWGPEGGGMFQHDATSETGQGMEQFRGGKAAINPIALPGKGQGIAALAGPTREGVAYGITKPGDALVAVDGSTWKVKVVAKIEGAAPVLVLLPDGRLIGAFAEGQLWEYSPESAGLAALDAHAPCQKGKRYVAGVQSLILGDDGLVYGGASTDGFMFTWDPGSGVVVNHGKPNRQSNIRALAQGRGGMIYGIVQEPEGMAHLFRFDPQAGFVDLGVVASSFPEHWTAHCLGSLAVGPGGELYIGETDAISHLFIHYPPIPK